MELLEVEYLLLTLDFGKILFLLAGFGSLQAALLKVFEPRSDGGTFHGPWRITAVLWRAEGRTKNQLKKIYIRSTVRLKACWVEGSNP